MQTVQTKKNPTNLRPKTIIFLQIWVQIWPGHFLILSNSPFTTQNRRTVVNSNYKNTPLWNKRARQRDSLPFDRSIYFIHFLNTKSEKGLQHAIKCHKSISYEHVFCLWIMSTVKTVSDFSAGHLWVYFSGSASSPKQPHSGSSGRERERFISPMWRTFLHSEQKRCRCHSLNLHAFVSTSTYGLIKRGDPLHHQYR